MQKNLILENEPNDIVKYLKSLGYKISNINTKNYKVTITLKKLQCGVFFR